MTAHPTPSPGGGGPRDPQPRDPQRSGVDAVLLDAVTDLRRDVADTRLPLPLDGVPEAEERRRRLLDQLDDHLLPRLRELSAPAVVVVAGSTGAGKSTLVNSVLGTEVSPAGVLRPTTRRPVLVHHPRDGELLAAHPLMQVVQVVEHQGVPRGLALVDAPDLDSLLASNRATAHRLLEAADLWLFVTTAARYGDALPWEVLGRAVERGTSMAMVLNRVPDDARVAVRGDLMQRLRERGMAAVPLFLVPDAGPHEGLLETAVVAPIRRWLSMVAGPDRARSVIARTQRGSLRALRPWVTGLVDAVQAQVDARVALVDVVQQAAQGQAEQAEWDTAGLADGPVRSRWAALSGGAGPLSRQVSRRGRRDRGPALEEVAAELQRSAELTLAACRRRAEAAVVHALGDPGLAGASGVLAALTETGAPDAPGAAAGLAVGETAPGLGTAITPAESAGDWLLTAEQSMRGLGQGDRAVARRLARVSGGSGPEGAGTIAAAAAVGLGAARTLLEEGLGRELVREPLAALRQDLTARAREQAEAGAQPALAVLTRSDLADDAASRLSLRLAVLKGLT